jgi:hypothetical protein
MRAIVVIAIMCIFIWGAIYTATLIKLAFNPAQVKALMMMALWLFCWTNYQKERRL